MSDFYGSAPEGKRIEYHEAKAERMTEDEQDLAAEILRLDAKLGQADKERGEWAARYHAMEIQAEKLAEALERLAFEPTMKDYRSVARAALAEWEKP